MEYLVGTILALAVAALATGFGLDRDRAFYPTVLIVVASYYSLFAAMGASTLTLEIESVVGVGFLALALIGFKKSMWLVAAAIAGHGLFDMVHHLFIVNAGMPVWWPGFCGTVDIILGVWLAICLWRKSPGL
jgi:hypothetical protein